MTKLGRAMALSLAPLTLIAGTAAMANRNSDELSCEVRATKVSGGILLEALASAGAEIAGEYEFIISKTGPGGSSDVSQGGEFEVGPGREALLGEVTLGSEGGSVEAVLTVRTPDGASCESRFPRPL
jgi:hypothetical protein